MAANSAFTFMLSERTFLDAAAIRFARSWARASRFMRSMALRMYSARDIFSACALRRLSSKRSAGNFSDIASMITSVYPWSVYIYEGYLKRVIKSNILESVANYSGSDKTRSKVRTTGWPLGADGFPARTQRAVDIPAARAASSSAVTSERNSIAAGAWPRAAAIFR